MKKLLKRILLVVIIFMMSSCDKGFEELNVNPNIPESVDPDALFAYGQHQYFTNYLHGVFTEVWSVNVWLQMQADLNGINTIDDAYFIGGDGIDNTWKVWYADVLGNVHQAIKLTNDSEEDVNRNAIYKIFFASVMHRITDLWGDVPYSEAFGAINEEGIPDFTPKYDDQRSIYVSLIEMLEEASAQLENGKPTPGNQDWIYQGSIDDWRRFSNSLTLRLCMRIAEKEGEWATSRIADLLTEGDLILNESQTAGFPHSSFAVNPFFELHSTGQGMRSPSAYLINVLKENDDPRISIYAALAPQTIILGAPDYVGVPNFLLSSEIDPEVYSSFTTSYLGSYFQNPNRETPVISAAEINFLAAEAILHGWAAGDAESYYYNGISSSMEYLQVADFEISDYLASGGLYQGTVEQIINEKYRSFVYTNPLEAFAEWRRTGFPILTFEDGSEINASNVPKRLAYPNSEISLNSENVQAVGEGINDFNSPVWWNE